MPWINKSSFPVYFLNIFHLRAREWRQNLIFQFPGGLTDGNFRAAVFYLIRISEWSKIESTQGGVTRLNILLIARTFFL